MNYTQTFVTGTNINLGIGSTKSSTNSAFIILIRISIRSWRCSLRNLFCAILAALRIRLLWSLRDALCNNRAPALRRK